MDHTAVSTEIFESHIMDEEILVEVDYTFTKGYPAIIHPVDAADPGCDDEWNIYTVRDAKTGDDITNLLSDDDFQVLEADLITVIEKKWGE